MDNKTTVDAIIWIVGLIVGSGLIEVSPININPWTWLLSPLRKAITGDLKEKVVAVDAKVDNVQKDLDNHIAEYQEAQAQASRQRILRFNDEILQHQKHTKEHFDDVLADIDKYEDYCMDHPKYPNNKAIMAIKNIKDVYEKCMQTNGFLTID